MHPDCVIADRYRLVRRIAVGGMSSVWEAWDERLQRRVALKQLEFRGGLGDEEGRLAAQRALREARITARLHHPNAVAVYDVIDHDGAPCLIMQYLPSKSLQRLIEEQGTLPVGDVVRFGREIVAALGAAHEAGIVHRDVKPGNVLIGEDGGARLTDFGISHAFGDATLTSSGIVTGTPAYLAPEVARGEPSSFQSDVFSLGATLYTAAEGTTAVEVGSNPMAVLHRVASGQIRPPRPGSPLEPLLVRMLAVDPKQRPTVREVARELTRLSGASDSAAGLPTDRLPKAAPTPPSTTVALPPARVAAPPAPPPVKPAPPDVPAAASPDLAPPPQRRHGTGWIAAVALVATLLLAGLIVLLATSLGPGSDGSGNSPAAAGSQGHRHRTPKTHVPRTHGNSSSPTTASSPAVVNPPPVQKTKKPKPPKSTVVSSSPEPPAGTSPDAQIGAVRDYYGLLPDDTADAWNRLTAGYQAQAGGRGGYEQFWHGFQSVTISNEQYSDGAVVGDLTYTRTDGSQTSETRSFTLVDDGGVLKIADSQVVG